MPSEWTNEQAILAMFRNGDEDAFKQVYDQHHRKIYLFAYSYLKSREQSEEVLQETFLKLWLTRTNLDTEQPVEALLFTICRNLVMDAFRKKLRTAEQRSLLVSEMAGEQDNHTEEKVILSDLMKFAENAIAELPRQQQTVFRLSKQEGMSYDEISQHLNISPNTVKNHLVGAMKTLRGKLQSQEICYTLLVLYYLENSF
jgi:RNA polymerase sigma-70 factor (family 1)